MTERLQEIVDRFALADDEMRLELLLDYARRIPPLPEALRPQRDAGLNRVPECMTPVFMWIERDDGTIHIDVDVAEEAPTVKGFLSIILDAYDGASAEALAEVPLDLIARLGLAGQIRMQRAVGIGAILGRLRRRGQELAASDPPTDGETT